MEKSSSISWGPLIETVYPITVPNNFLTSRDWWMLQLISARSLDPLQPSVHAMSVQKLALKSTASAHFTQDSSVRSLLMGSDSFIPVNSVLSYLYFCCTYFYQERISPLLFVYKNAVFYDSVDRYEFRSMFHSRMIFRGYWEREWWRTDWNWVIKVAWSKVLADAISLKYVLLKNGQSNPTPCHKPC